MTFQTPPSIPGITNFNLVNNFPKSSDILKLLSKYKKDMLKLQLGQCWNQRNFNEGASGGERKKNELLQLLQSNPKIVILDELDTGLDVDALKIILKIINEHKSKYGWLVISHSSKVLKNLNPNYVHILQNGKINETGGADLLDKIEEKGFLNATK
jgi:Fe-S cluster assembly ATP-binding protein